MTRKYGTYAGEFPGILLIVPDGVWHPVSRRQEMSQTPSVGAEPVEGWIFDDIARTFVLNDGVCRFFEGMTLILSKMSEEGFLRWLRDADHGAKYVSQDDGWADRSMWLPQKRFPDGRR